MVLSGDNDWMALATSANDKADFIGASYGRSLDAEPVAVLLVVCKCGSRLDPWDNFVKGVWCAGACSDDDIVAKEVDASSWITNSRHFDGSELPLFGLFDVGDFLAEAKFDALFFAHLVEVFGETSC